MDITGYLVIFVLHLAPTALYNPIPCLTFTHTLRIRITHTHTHTYTQMAGATIKVQTCTLGRGSVGC